MLIECDTCAVRGEGCGHCVIAELLGAPPERVLSTPREPVPGAPPEKAPSASPGERPATTRPEPIAWEPTERELSEWDLDAAERRALHVLAMAGLIAPASQAPGADTRTKGGFSRVERAS